MKYESGRASFYAPSNIRYFLCYVSALENIKARHHMAGSGTKQLTAYLFCCG